MNKYEITIYYSSNHKVRTYECTASTFEFANKKFAKYLQDPDIVSFKVEMKKNDE